MAAAPSENQTRASHPSPFLRRLGALALHMLWPVSCPVCGRVAEVLCDGCAASLLVPAPPRCLRCGVLSPCPRHPNAPIIRPASDYGERIKPVIHALKYDGFRALGPRLGRAMSALWPRPEADLLLPVPLHVGSARGYNQAFEIARGLGRAWGVEAADLARWTKIVTRRTRLNMAERMSLRADAFAVSPKVEGLRVALVDDVCTTGATLSRLASACEAAGAVVVGAYVAASPMDKAAGVPHGI